jgi:carbonic anhydrase
MINTKILFTTASLVISCASWASDQQQSHDKHWDYSGDQGPAHWHSLNPDYQSCSQGQSQSPIDLNSQLPVTSAFIEKQYQAATMRIAHHEHVVDILDNGHTIQVTYDEGSELITNGQNYNLAQFHFHAPSEHTVDGKFYPMEMHLVHSNKNGALAVVSVLIKEGEHNESFTPIFEHMPKTAGKSVHLEHMMIDIDELLPSVDRYYHYNGSLTTPPCSEGVSWFVLAEPVSLSAAQIKAFTAIINHNNRPIQALNGREVRMEAGGKLKELPEK